MTFNYDPILGLQYFNTYKKDHTIFVELDCLPVVDITEVIKTIRDMGVCFNYSCGNIEVETNYIKHNLYYLLA